MNGSFNLSEWAIKRQGLVVFLMLLGAIAGAFSYTNLGRSEDPDFTVKTMLVHAVWPGGTVDQTIDQVTDRLEKTLQEVPYLDTLRSLTSAGNSIIYVTLLDSTPPAAVADVWYQVRKKVGDIQHTLPAGIRGPFFNDDFGDTFGIIYGFTSDDFSDREVRDWAEKARSRLLRLDNIGKIEFLGTQDETIYIEFSTQRLASLGLSGTSIISTIQAQNAVLPTGQMTTETDRTILEVSGDLRDENDIRNINVPTASGFVRLGDIATVTRGTVDPPQPMFRIKGKPAIGLAVSMASGGDVIALGRNIKTTMAEFEQDLPIGIDVVQVADQPDVVTNAIRGFTISLSQAVLIVLGCSFVALGFRAGFVVAVSIPLVMAMTFLAMDITGIALQRVSLGALIIALTLMIDDAMVAVEMMMSKLEEGYDRVKAASYAYTSTAFPMLAGTLVTIAGFIPVGFARSVSGEYARSLFLVIAFALILSWLIAVLLTPIVGLAVLKSGKKDGPQGDGKLVLGFKKILLACIPPALRSSSRHDRHVRGGAVCVLGDEAAVLPAIRQAGTDPAVGLAAKRLAAGHRNPGETRGGDPRRRPGRGRLELLRRLGCHPLLSADGHPAAGAVSRAGRRHQQERRGPRRIAGAAAEGARREVPGHHRPGLAA